MKQHAGSLAQQLDDARQAAAASSTARTYLGIGPPRAATAGADADTCFACNKLRLHDCLLCQNGCCNAHYDLLNSLCFVCNERKADHR